MSFVLLSQGQAASSVAIELKEFLHNNTHYSRLPGPLPKMRSVCCVISVGRAYTVHSYFGFPGGLGTRPAINTRLHTVRVISNWTDDRWWRKHVPCNKQQWQVQVNTHDEQYTGWNNNVAFQCNNWFIKERTEDIFQ